MEPIDFEHIFRQAPTAFSIVDLDGRQIDGSDHYWDLFGLDPSSADPADPVIARVTDRDDAEITRRYFDELRRGAIDEITLEKRYRRADGAQFWGRLRASPIVDDRGEIVAIAGVITDISAEREAREALVASEVARAKTDHRVVAEAIRRFVGGIEHEVRSPLHSILGLTELVAQGMPPTEEQGRALYDEAQRLQQLVEEIADFAGAAVATTADPAQRPRRRLDGRWATALDAAAADQRRQTAPAVGDDRPRLHVLVVDDGEVNRLLAVSQLQRLGYTSATAHNGLEAVERARTEHFDAILMDWHMPVLDGLGAARQIRDAEPSGAHVPIIAVTASVIAGHRDACLDVGMNEVLVKPVTIAALDQALRRWIPDAPPPIEGPAIGQACGAARSAARVSQPGSSPRVHRSSIDPRALEELERETGDRSVVGVIIDTYLDELGQRLEVIGAVADAVRARDLDASREIMRSSHTLKSTAALVGATRLSHLCEQLQILTAEPPGPAAIAVADALTAEAHRTVIDLQTVRRRL